MSLQLAAQHLAAQGRGPDKQLVHMSPREVAGLQALAKAGGGSLSINPETGLPEAGFLDNMLPAVIGAGLMFATGGTAAPLIAGISNPALIGLGLGAFETARTGNLERGLMAGLGAYGGAGLMGTLAGAGAAGATGAGATGAGATGAATQAAPAVDLGAGTYQIAPSYSLAPSPSAVATDMGLKLQSATPIAGDTGLGLAATQPYTGFQSVASTAGQPISSLPQQFSPGLKAAGFPTSASAAGAPTIMPQPTFAEKLAAAPKKDLLKYGLAAASPSLLATPKYKAPVLDNERYIYSYDPGYKGMPPQGYAGEYPYFQPKYTRLAAEGGLMGRARRAITGGDDNQGDDRQRYTYDPVKQQYAKVALPPAVVAEALDQIKAIDVGSGGFDGQGGSNYGGGFGATSGQLGPGASAAEGAAIGEASAAAQANAGLDSAVDASGDAIGMARGGISDLGDYSDGGRLLRGPGDGVSDSIPAMIGRKQPARLADGEFVIPARIVSELGNGSTDAGARKLYAMMDRIQKARGKTVGKGKVAKNSRAEKYLPA